MRAINHAITGAIIGLTITNPIALPLAFMSHYALDVIPHHGYDKPPRSFAVFKIILIVDILLCIALVAVLGIRHPSYWWLAVLCAFLAATPDLMWVGDFKKKLIVKSKEDLAKRHAIVRFHFLIQWFERPIGIVVEIAWALAAAALLGVLLSYP